MSRGIQGCREKRKRRKKERKKGKENIISKKERTIKGGKKTEKWQECRERMI